MPEGDVVWRTAERLRAALVGRPLLGCDLRWPSLAGADLTGRTVVAVLARGKHLLVRVDGHPPLTLHSHLRMEGSWRVSRTAGAGARAGVGSDARAILANEEWTATGLRLGMLDLVETADEDRVVGHLGPDLLGDDWDVELALARLRADPGRPVGEALLDQRVLAGIGTMYLAETMFLRGRSPWTPVADVDAAGELRRVVELAQRLLMAGRQRVSQSTTGDTRPGRETYVHARSGRPCRRCGTTVRVASLGSGPTSRVVFYCPSCQPGPTPTDDGRPQRPLGASAPTRRRGT